MTAAAVFFRPIRLAGRKRSAARWLLQSLGVAVLVLAAWFGGLLWYADRIPAGPAHGEEATDAIVVLTGGSGRLSEGLRLLAEGRGKRLFVSGVYRGIDVDALLQLARRKPDDVECCITVGYAADNTAGNARETAEWVRADGHRSLRLVTANYHLPRSLLEFRRALPDIRIVPHPVFPEAFRRDCWWCWRNSLLLVASEFHKYLAALAGLSSPGAVRG